MLDHIFLDLVSGVRHSLESALLERQGVEERFQVDVFLGDLSWETSYGLPGEESPPRVRADVSLDWSTWSQSIFRSWSIGEPADDPPEAVLEVSLRLQRLAGEPPLERVLAIVDADGPMIGLGELERSTVGVERLEPAGTDDQREWAVEVPFEATLRLEERLLEEPALLEKQLEPLGAWIASRLVRLADLDVAFLPPEEDAGDSNAH